MPISQRIALNIKTESNEDPKCQNPQAVVQEYALLELLFIDNYHP